MTVAVQATTEHVQVHIHWAGGTVSEHPLCRPVGSYERLADFPRLRQQLAAWVGAGWTAAQIAEALNREGFRSASGRLDGFTARGRGVDLPAGAEQETAAGRVPVGQ